MKPFGAWPKRLSLCVFCLATAVAAFPAEAQNTDPFRSAPAPPPVVLPQPRPRPAPEPEPATVAPPAAPAQPAAAPGLVLGNKLWARIREVALAEGITVPLVSSPPFDEASTAPAHRVLLGAWGPATWQGDTGGDELILVVQSVDGEEKLHAVVCKNAGKVMPAFWAMAFAPITGAKFSLEINGSPSPNFATVGIAHYTETWSFELQADGRMRGTRNGGASSILLTRLQ